MKKVLAILLAVLFVIPVSFTASAGDADLKFNSDGKFTIIHICDIQDDYPLNRSTYVYIQQMLAEVKPDLVILGGDNTVCSDTEEEPQTKQKAVEEICNLFVESETYFTLVFGNHDRQQGYSNDELLPMYQQYGGKYCLAYDADPALTNCGTHCLPIKSSDGSKVAYNLFMFDSGENAYDEAGNDIGYDSVHADQIEWYKNVVAESKAANGGKVVPSMAFQHIIVEDVYDELFPKVPVSVGVIGNDFEDGHYIYLPKVSCIKSGFMFERPAAGYYNFGQLDAMAECGDVVAIFSAHDHVNDFTIPVKGIDVVNSPSCTFHSYSSDLNQGSRVIVLDEKDTSTYSTYIYTVAEAALKDGSKICDQGDVTEFGCRMSIIGAKLLNALMAVVKVLLFWF